MSEIVLKDCKLYVAQYDLSGDVNELELEHAVEVKDKTTFASGGARERKAGLRHCQLRSRGYVNPGTGLSDEGLFTKVGVNDSLVTVCPTDGADGERALAFAAAVAEYAPAGTVGEMFGFSVGAQGSDKYGLIRGTVMAPKASRTVTGNGTARVVGAVGATQKLYAGLHVFAKAGTTPTLDVVIESDDASGFASAITRQTFTQKTDVGSEWLAPVSGAIADTWWRARWTIGGTTPDFTFFVFVGIQ